MAALIIVSGYTSINAVVKAELFPAEIRALGVGLPFAVAVSVFGGTAEYIALYFKSIGHETWFYWYVTTCIAASFLVYVLIAGYEVHIPHRSRLRRQDLRSGRPAIRASLLPNKFSPRIGGEAVPASMLAQIEKTISAKLNDRGLSRHNALVQITILQDWHLGKPWSRAAADIAANEPLNPFFQYVAHRVLKQEVEEAKDTAQEG